jgi:hypothetical protein
LRSRQAIVQVIVGDDPAQRAITMSRDASGKVMVERFALPDRPPGVAIGLTVKPAD